MRSCTRPIALVLTFQLLIPPAALAELAGEQVVSGQASIERSGNVTTVHASDGAIINYSQFDVWKNEELRFVQPTDVSRVLNRVYGDATHIDGALYANGIVYIVNPAGVFFGSGAIVDVGGLYAAAGNISNEDFLAHRDAFSLTGEVGNEGSIVSPTAALVGKAVANHGSISAPNGTIALVAGDKVVLTQLGAHIAVEVEGTAGNGSAPAIEQTGSVDAGTGSVSFATGDVYSLAINHTGITRGGEIGLSAASGTVSVSGTLDASNHSAGATGGDISVTGERVALVGAQLDASGDAGGGTIRVGGDQHGDGPLANARRTWVDADSSLRADAITTGDGGRVVVWSDEATGFNGQLSARGGAAGGDGGFAEISGAQFLSAKGDVDLGAPAGANGTLLYDPKEIQLVGGTADGSDSPDAQPGGVSGDSGTAGQILFSDVGDLATPFRVFESEIEGTNANVVLEAAHSISATGTFDHDASGEGTGVVRLLDGNSLTLRTRNDPGDETGATNPTAGIDLAGVSFETSGAGTITLATGTGTQTSVHADIRVADLATGGGSVSVTTEDGGITVGDVTTAGADDAVNGSNGGVISIIAHDAGGSPSSDVVTGTLNSSGGNGGTGSGGNGGAVAVQSIGTRRDIAGTATDPIEGGGSITVAGIDATGGAGTTRGGAGGSAVVGGVLNPFTGQPVNTTDGAITVTGAIDTSGGDGAGTGSVGGSAGAITIIARDANRDDANDVTTAPLIARGGNGVATGGAGGAVTVETLKSIEITGATNSGDNQTAAGGGDIVFDHIDTSEGTPNTNSADGGSILLVAQNGDIEHGAQAGPHIVTNGSVSFDATGGVGAASPIEITGGGETADQLLVAAGSRADLRVTTGFFGKLVAIAKTVDADIDVTQTGGDAIDMEGLAGQMLVHRADGRGNNVDVEIQLQDEDGSTSDSALVLENGSVTAGGVFRAFSEGNIVLGTATSGSAPVITAGSKDPAIASNVLLSADTDRDGQGAIVDGAGTTGVIDMLGASAAPGALGVLATSGIGTETDPIVTTGGVRLSAANGPITTAGDPDSTATSGIYVRNVGSGEVVIASGAVPGVAVTAGTGEVQIENQAGNIRVNGTLRVKPDDPADGAGGDLTLTVNPGSQIVLNTSKEIASGGVQTYRGDVVLARTAFVAADGGIAIEGGLDTKADAATPVSFAATLGDEPTDVTPFSVQDGIGTTRALAQIAIDTPDGGGVALDTPIVHTTSTQFYGSDLTLAQATAFTTGTVIVFDKDGAQSVTGSAGGFSLDAGGSSSAVPRDATIGKSNGDLTLTSTGPVTIGDGDKLSVAGSLAISGSTVRVTDLSALDISVTSPDIQIFARPAGAVDTPGGGTIADRGTDLVANTMTFSTAPTVVGAGPQPRIATLSGSATNAEIPGGTLPSAIQVADLASSTRLFDLAIPTPDPGHETQELSFAPVAPPLEVLVSKDKAAPGPAVSREEVVAFLSCAPLGEELAPSGCTDAPLPTYGSALDTERAPEVARAYRDLLGERGRAGRESLANAASASGGDLGAAASPAGRAYLTEIARVLGQVRLLGLGARYPEVRSDLLTAITGAIGAPGLDSERLGAAVDTRSMGMPI
jgi:filamentous hemagglutinin family protein